MINHLALLLERFKNIRDPKEERQRIALIISRELGFEVAEDKVVLKKGILSISADNYLKAEIFMRKEALLEALKTEKISVFEKETRCRHRSFTGTFGSLLLTKRFTDPGRTKNLSPNRGSGHNCSIFPGSFQFTFGHQYRLTLLHPKCRQPFYFRF